MSKREVLFSEYCPECKYCENEDYDDPCNECLMHPWNEDSRKPVEFREREDA